MKVGVQNVAFNCVALPYFGYSRLITHSMHLISMKVISTSTVLPGDEKMSKPANPEKLAWLSVLTVVGVKFKANKNVASPFA